LTLPKYILFTHHLLKIYLEKGNVISSLGKQLKTSVDTKSFEVKQ